MPARVRGFCQYGRYHTIEVEDVAAVYAEYNNGMTAQFITTTGEPSGTNRLEITADKGKVVIEESADGFRFRHYSFAQSEREFNATFTVGFGEPAVTVEEYFPEETFPYFDGHKKVLRNFAEVVVNGGELIAPGEEGIKTVELINAINYSAWTDGWAEIPVDPDRYLAALREKIASSRIVKTSREIEMDVSASK